MLVHVHVLVLVEYVFRCEKICTCFCMCLCLWRRLVLVRCEKSSVLACTLQHIENARVNLIERLKEISEQKRKQINGGYLFKLVCNNHVHASVCMCVRVYDYHITVALARV